MNLTLKAVAQITTKLQELKTLAEDFNPGQLDHDCHVLKETVHHFCPAAILLGIRIQRQIIQHANAQNDAA